MNKKILILLAAAICCMPAIKSQETKATAAGQEAKATASQEAKVTSNGALSFHVSYTEEETKRGELYQYSERYLGTSDVIKEDGTSYRLLSIDMRQSPDAAKSGNGGNGKNINGGGEGKSGNIGGKGKDIKIGGREKRRLQLPAPLNEETLTATNTAKKAEGVAKQIYRLREARVSIVSGEAEHAPADGMAMEVSLRELKEMEKQLTELFTGSTRTSAQHINIRYEIEESLEAESEEVLMRFSKHAGPVDADDLSGEPVYLKITRVIGPKEDGGKKKKKNEQAEQEVKEMKITVEYDGHKLLQRTLKK
ncbi:MAG: DUF4831 family protein [Paludibacteraceae bacterium]|nr:DUF4831 family protein [Paludibacteraceae bacterium]